MLKNYRISIIGGDLRQIYMANNFIEKSHQVTVYALEDALLTKNYRRTNTLTDAVNFSDIILLPIPVTRDKINIFALKEWPDLQLVRLMEALHSNQFLIGGNIPECLLEYCNTSHIATYDLMKDDKITIRNTIATAEGAIMEAIKHSTCNLHKSNCLVLGYGKCATVLAHKLSSLDANVCIAARREAILASAESFGYDSILLSKLKDSILNYDYIFNTIPSLILTKEILKKLSLDTTIIDIASSPGGIDYSFAKKRNLNAHLCLGLPGKVAPRSSANILADTILKTIKERSE